MTATRFMNVYATLRPGMGSLAMQPVSAWQTMRLTRAFDPFSVKSIKVAW
jgi:hypothetical protein